ncbi:hypothetical protein FNF29_04072 [Cafeteria roenbergensis]|uniref:E3 ubiquitin-protein ligase synoviolin-like TPR repeats domain-containing protein n=1 Tax=Cafeteria roenbergensis TaxID=33653 RepID=A0A5A8CGT9_CAFRO|nr:hypothetical protein FNF29_04072 [Cafeteria roenbergensis]|eukprot:KAA0152206.1 hypothetical protein FNF29_04072 [Cafeteria roenbergensis]
MADEFIDLDAQAREERGPTLCQKIGGWLPSASFTAYVVLSALAATVAVYHAFDTRQYLYDALVYLSTSKVNLTIMANLFVAVVLSLVLAVTTLTVGTVEPDERERVWSAAQFAVVDLAFNLTVFREEVTVWMLLRLILLLAAKYFHELFDARMDNLERHGMAGPLRHVRLLAGLALFAVADVAAAASYAQTVADSEPSVAIMFAFEHASLALSACLVAYRYLLWSVEQRMAQEWRAKSTYFAWGSLAVNVLKLAINLVYLFVIYRAFGMPLIMVREVIRSGKAVVREFSAITAALRLRHLISQRFHVLSVEDVAAIEDKTSHPSQRQGSP